MSLGGDVNTQRVATATIRGHLQTLATSLKGYYSIFKNLIQKILFIYDIEGFLINSQ